MKMEKLILTLGITLCYCLEGEAVLYKHFGCYKDNSASPELNAKEVTLSSINIKDCAVGCNSDGHPYMGIMGGSRCFCGDEYGRLGTEQVSECNYTCPLEGISASTDACGGVGTTSVFYASDSDPVTRVDRIFIVYPSAMSWLDARHYCVKKNGDLAILAGYNEVNLVKSTTNTTAGMTGTNVWVGLFKMDHLQSEDFIWTDQTSFALDYDRYWDPTANTFDPTKLCVYLNTATMKLIPAPCSTSMPFVCKQLPNPDLTTDATNGDATEASDSDGGLTEDEKKRNRIMLYVLLPVFIICYGGSCLVYVIGKIWKNLRMKRKKLQMQAAFEEEYEPDTKPIMGAMHKQSSPPPYYQGPQTPMIGMTPEQKQYRGRQKMYQHEMEPSEPKEDEIDFSKLSIQDIIYIKSLMGERHSVPEGKKRKILVA